MKTVLTILLFVCFSTFGYSQSKIEYGLTTEGSWFMPQKNSKYSQPNKAGFGTGVGIYASRNIWWRFSADIGLAYRYKEMQQHYQNYSNSEPGYTNTGSSYGYTFTNPDEGWEKYPHHYLVIPIKIQLLVGKRLFLNGGIEASWLTNYSMVSEKPEFNWIMGFGSKTSKLKWSINLIRGFKPQGFANGLFEYENGKYKSGTVYQNNMLQLSFSYPIRLKK